MTLVHYARNGSTRLHLGCNIHEFLKGCMLNAPPPLEMGEFTYKVEDNWNLNGDKERFAHEVVWYGRKGGKFAYDVSNLMMAEMVS